MEEAKKLVDALLYIRKIEGFKEGREIRQLAKKFRHDYRLFKKHYEK